MNNTKAEYKQRLHEIDLYFSMFKVLDNVSCTLESIDLTGKNVSLPIDAELIKIIKANGFILLYNLIEATVRNSITAVINSISAEKVTYKKVTDEIRQLWVKQEFKSTNDIGSVRGKVHEVMSNVLNDTLFELRSDCVTISGNIDAQEIRNISKQLGCIEPKNGSTLVQIKNKRNQLAHGEKTFAEIGKDFTVKDLITFKDETSMFIESVIANVEQFINNKGYLRP
jgi:hypothetical protein